MADFAEARTMLAEFKGDSYIHGLGVLTQVGSATAAFGSRAALVVSSFSGAESYIRTIVESLTAAGVDIVGQIQGPRPNAPLEDLARMTQELIALDPDVIVSFGGGSTIDAAKAAEVLRTLGGVIEDYFGTGLVSAALAESESSLTPHVAIQTAASSGAHLTKYANITDINTGQKKLIVDDAIVPQQPVFDYEVTFGAPWSLTADGALDGIAHSLEVLYGAVGLPYYERMVKVAYETIDLVLEYLPTVIDEPQNAEAREALGLATDLGGYAIMLGGTNGGHLTSFSLVDILSHGRACAIMNPYYTVFFSNAVQGPLTMVGQLYAASGDMPDSVDDLEGRALGESVARAMIHFEERIGFPATLGEVPGFSDAHITRALTAAKNPQLKMKLENMPIPLTADMVDEYMGPVLEAAKAGDLSIIKLVD